MKKNHIYMGKTTGRVTGGRNIQSLPKSHFISDREMRLETALLTILDAVDYEAGACRPTEMVGAVLPSVLIANARKALGK